MPDEIICPACGAALPPTATVCPRNGTPLGRTDTMRSIGQPDWTDPDLHLPAAGDRTDPNLSLSSGVFDPGTLLGSYRILALLGQGGMGQVYLAEHLKLGRQLALQVLRSRWASDPELVKRFFIEAQAVNRIKHPAIVEVTDLVDEGGLVYFIMELLHHGATSSWSSFTMELLTGRSLKERLGDGPLPLPELLAIARPIADALAAVHDAGIVHRDLKPGTSSFSVPATGRASSSSTSGWPSYDPRGSTSSPRAPTARATGC